MKDRRYAEYIREHDCRCGPIVRGWHAAEQARALLTPPPDFLTDYTGSRWSDLREQRDPWVAAYSWAVPTREAIACIAEHVGDRLLLDPMCGTGYWASLLRLAGMRILASDVAPGANHWAVGSHIDDAVTLDAFDAVRSVTPDALLLVWPPYAEDVASRTLAAFRGDRLVYVGEGEGGCTADDEFHAALARDWESRGTVAIPQWPGMNDYLEAFARRRT